MLLQGITRYWVDGSLQRIEDCVGDLKTGSWLLLDRFKNIKDNDQRCREAVSVAAARKSRLAIMVDAELCEYAVDLFCLDCHAAHAADDLSLRIIKHRSWQDFLCSSMEDWHALLDEEDHSPGARILRNALSCGLSHLQLNRNLKSLSLGEARRIELLSWMAQARTGQTLIFDEPGIGLHGQERMAVATLFRQLVATGNTVITADPSYEFLASADHCMLVGPGAGEEGGTLCASGSLQQLNLQQAHGFAAAQALPPRSIVFDDLHARHLKIDKLEIPLACVVAICGVSGSGKSTLFAEELWPRLKDLQKTHKYLNRGGVHALLQRSLGVSARSTLATLSGCWSELRELFAATQQAQQRGFKAADFVASPARGACKSCKGLAVDPFSAACERCAGLALRDELLELRYRGASLREWLNTPLQRLLIYLPIKGKLRNCIELLIKLGLGSRRLGERGKVFSFGERGRIALARKLCLIRPGLSKLFLLDEACLGLPDNEAGKFIEVLNEFCKDGHSFWLIEHHHLVLRNARHLIEIGPQAGADGGEVVYSGAPEGLTQQHTATAQWLCANYDPPQALMQPQPPSAKFTIYADGSERQGYTSIRSELVAELGMRSVLTHNQFSNAGDKDLGPKHPVAWPTPLAARCSLLESLGLDDYLQQLLQQIGKKCCSHCGGVGPYLNLAEFVFSLEQKACSYACALPAAIEQHPQREMWLAAAGYRKLIDESYIELDHFDVAEMSASELSERCSDIEQQLQKLQQVELLVFADSKVVGQINLRQCRDCHVEAALEFRLGKYSIEHLRAAKLDDALKLFNSVKEDALISHALHLLAPSSLLSKNANTTMQNLTSVEQRAARIYGLLFFGPQQLCLLFDNVFAGFPAKFGRFLASECRKSGLMMHHADAAGYFDDDPPANLGSGLPRPQQFTNQFSFNTFIPSAAQAQNSLAEALELSLPLAEYFSRCETAKLLGYKHKDLLLKSTKYKCKSCKGTRTQQLHPALHLACSSCHATGFDSGLSKLIERGLSFTQAQQQPLDQLATHLAGTRMASTLEMAVKCGLGAYSLNATLSELPLAVRCLAPLIANLDGGNGDLHIHGIFDGLNALQVKQLCSTIQGSVTGRALLEWRENHPQFIT
ncbi:MAG: energy-coupling factor transporter ATP-binding protein EcfA2 [Myxococcota bacterium]